MTSQPPLRIALLGRGRAARSLAPLLAAVDLGPVWWWSRGDPSPISTLPAVDIVLLAVPDAAIEEAAAALSTRAGATEEIWLHLSGSRPGSVARHDAIHPRAAGCLHPVQALPGIEVDGSHLHGVTAGIDGEDDACQAAAIIAQALGMTPRRLSDGTKPLYHAAAVTVAGHATALFAQAQAMLAECGFDEPTARATLLPLMRGALDNLRHEPARSVVTGPIARADPATVAAHLRALDATDPHLAATYRRLARTALALSADGLDDAAHGELAALIGPGSPD